MGRVLVVDDDRASRLLMTTLLESEGHEASSYQHPDDALAAARKEQFDLVIVDTIMPGMTGIEFLDEVRMFDAALPVILVTAYGDEQLVLDAFRHGATNYLAKGLPTRQFRNVVNSALAISEDRQQREDLIDCLVSDQVELRLDNSLDKIAGVTSLIKERLEVGGLFSPAVRLQIVTGLGEAISNAIIHGNLGIASELREQIGGRAFVETISQRQQDPAYRNRRVNIKLRWNQRVLTARVTDEGAGFDVESLPVSFEPESITNDTGRGVLLMRNFFDGVHFNARGNEVLMVKRIRSARVLAPSQVA